MFGGVSQINDEDYFSDVWSFTLSTTTWEYYRGTMNFGDAYNAFQTFSMVNSPKDRAYHSMVKINEESFAIYGGNYYGEFNSTFDRLFFLDCLFIFKKTPITQTPGIWNWEFGTIPRECCTTRTLSPANPGGRVGVNMYFKSETNSTFILNGGNYIGRLFTDVWEYDLDDHSWSFSGGNSTNFNIFCDYNVTRQYGGLMGSRYHSISWKINDEIYFFGGIGYASSGERGLLNDIWVYHLTSKKFKFEGGSQQINQNSIVINSLNFTSGSWPSGRSHSLGILTSNSEVTFFGGNLNYTSFGNYYSQDIWTYNFITAQFSYVAGDIGIVQGSYGSSYNPSNWPGSRYGMVGLKLNRNELLLYSGKGSDDIEDGPIVMNDLWFYQFCEICPPLSSCNNYECACNSGYIFEQNVCVPNCDSPPCAGNATCISPGVCQCNSYFKGNGFDNCTHYCEPCALDAECVGPNNCKCITGYKPDPTPFMSCIPDCDSLPCGNFSACISPGNCSCIANYTGDPYSYECDPICDTCVQNAVCVSPFNCQCDLSNGYEGNGKIECTPICDSPECGYNAYCDIPGTCVCFDNYTGSPGPYVPYGCLPNCDGGCGINADCVSPNNCQCWANYTGNPKYKCNPMCNGCVEFANCTTPFNCECQTNYTGDGDVECTPICSIPCGNNSNCILPNNCECFQDFIGDPYEECLPNCIPSCGNNSYCNNSIVCVCNNGYRGDPLTTCEPYCSIPCGNNANCILPDTCECYENYEGNVTKECTPVCKDEYECGFGAECTLPTICECLEGYEGVDPYDFCLPHCEPNLCGDNAECYLPDECRCLSSYYGDPYEGCSQCIGGCGENAECINSTCVCFSGYYGNPLVACSLPSCIPSCGPNATCYGNNICKCNFGYVGNPPLSPCEPEYICDPECHENGHCIDFNNNCECNKGYTGDGRNNCEVSSVDLNIVIGIVGGGVGVFILLIVVIVLVFVFCIIFVYYRAKKKVPIESSVYNECGSDVSPRSSFNADRELSTGSKDSKEKSNDRVDDVLRRENIANVAKLSINEKLFEIDFNDITIIKSIGKGGSNSIIFLAKYGGTDVAFKCFQLSDFLDDDEKFKEFEKEVEILGSVNHRNFYGATLRVPRVGILMEYCDNFDLRKFFLSINPQYPLKERLRVVEEIASACSYLHKRSIIHRDLKCGNVLLTKNYEAKLMDFGLSRFIDSMSATKTTRIGTSYYMAPEVTLSSHYTNKCDVFSYGIMLWIIVLNNFKPYGEVVPMNVEIRIATDSSYRPNIADVKDILDVNDWWIADLMVNCWSENPDERKEFQEIFKILNSKRESVVSEVNQGTKPIDLSDDEEIEVPQEFRKHTKKYKDKKSTRKKTKRDTKKKRERKRSSGKKKTVKKSESKKRTRKKKSKKLDMDVEMPKIRKAKKKTGLRPNRISMDSDDEGMQHVKITMGESSSDDSTGSD